MKWFKKKEKKKKKNNFAQIHNENGHQTSVQQYGTLSPTGPSYIAKLVNLKPEILERIFFFVCPHAQDETYETCEQSSLGGTCMLCDLRDLARCAQVSRRWRQLAINVLYHSIRIDAVHYCPREEVLAEKRKRKSFLSRNSEPEDVPAARLRLLGRTLRENKTTLAPLVGFLKTPYMTREAYKTELAQILAVLANIRYVDLPEGLYMDDASCNVLRQTIQAGCPEIRKMTYMAGGERSLGLLTNGNVWPKLEVLELSGLNMDPVLLRRVLGSMPNLHGLKVSDMKAFNDELFRSYGNLPPLPAFTELIFEDVPNLTVQGLAGYLFRSDAQNALKTLSLTTTGIQVWDLHHILALASSLENLTVEESVSQTFPSNQNIPLLKSDSLKELRFEILTGSSANSFSSTTEGYYNYLAGSLLSNGLPNLIDLYARDQNFDELLIDLAPPAPAFNNYSPPNNPFASPPKENHRFSSNNPFAQLASPTTSVFNHSTLNLKQNLNIWCKGAEEENWAFSTLAPPLKKPRNGSISNGRPLSSYGLKEPTGPAWANSSGVRRSTIIPTGGGGFLAIPAEGERPRSSAAETGSGGKGKREYDMWR